jgi:RNA polymerase sigma-70 factor (ECF subfamily)
MDEAQASDVVRGLRAGETDAWRRLYDAYAERVWRGVARLIGPHSADVADVVQEAMLAAARSVRSFDETKGTLWQWLWGIARTQVQLHFRKKQRHERWKELPAAWSEGSDPTQATALETAEIAAMVRCTLAELPGDYDSLLTAKYLDGEAVELIAGRERLTETAVRSKLARAREAFKRAFVKLKEKVP